MNFEQCIGSSIVWLTKGRRKQRTRQEYVLSGKNATIQLSRCWGKQNGGAVVCFYVALLLLTREKQVFGCRFASLLLLASLFCALCSAFLFFLDCWRLAAFPFKSNSKLCGAALRRCCIVHVRIKLWTSNSVPVAFSALTLSQNTAVEIHGQRPSVFGLLFKPP